jgi:glucosamine kinase
MSFVLGIDGGGSKCSAAVSDGVSILGIHTSGGCNLNATTSENARHAIHAAVHGALSAAGVSPTAVSTVCAGVAGATSPNIAAQINSFLAEVLPRASIQVVGDTAIALEAAFTGGPGVICISGTGSVAYGRNERGEIARAGGWGRLISDEGSGHWIGQRAVSQCVRALDMGRSSLLIHGIMEHWQIVTREQLLQRCHRDQTPDFSELFPVVLAASDNADPLACEILTAAGTELARIAQVVLRRLWVGHSRLEIAINGGVFANSPRIRQVFGNIIRTERPEVHVGIRERQPYEGALYLAKQAIPGSAAS